MSQWYLFLGGKCLRENRIRDYGLCRKLRLKEFGEEIS